MTQAQCEWGLAGIEAHRNRAAVFVIVDVLSFCTAVDVAVSRGAVIHPFPYGDNAVAQAAADAVGAVLALSRRAAGGQISLSPASLAGVAAGRRIMLPSPNGSRLSLACGPAPVLAGCFRNAAAVARAAQRLAGDGPVCVIPAGERWPDGSLRPAIEDLLGAGAILHHLQGSLSPEAELARTGFRAVGSGLARLVCQSVSGRELSDGGFADDVAMALDRDVSRTVPMLTGGAYRAM